MMDSLSYKNRIALSYIGATANLIILVFLVIYVIVEATIYHHIDEQLENVSMKHTQEVVAKNGKMFFVNKAEWEEREHTEIDVNPVFIELRDKKGQLMDKSPNLKQDNIKFDSLQPPGKTYTAKLKNQDIRIKKTAIIRDNKLEGFIVAALPIEGYTHALRSLRNTMLMSLPFLLVILYFVARYLAGKSIRPVNAIIQTAKIIERDSLNHRIPTPSYKDELYTLVTAINDLLNRIEAGMKREMQFTSDAAHQLKTPLAVLKGTFEVLIRKPRTKEEFIKKISVGIEEIDRMNTMVDQLLVMARMESFQHQVQFTEFSVVGLIDEIIQRFSSKIMEKSIRVSFEPKKDFVLFTDPFLLKLILDNLISNAIKYSDFEQQIEVIVNETKHATTLEVRDHGSGISTEDIQHIFNPFYRAQRALNDNIEGDGLGLSIVQKACQLAAIELDVRSELNKGTCFKLSIKK